MPTAVLVHYIDEHRDSFGVGPICQVLRDADLKIAPSIYYAAKARPLSARAVRDEQLKADIVAVHAENLGVYGARKVHAELNREGVAVARCTVERLVREVGLRGLRRDKTIKTTSGDGAETWRSADLVGRAFAAAIKPRTKWNRPGKTPNSPPKTHYIDCPKSIIHPSSTTSQAANGHSHKLCRQFERER